MRNPSRENPKLNIIYGVSRGRKKRKIYAIKFRSSNSQGTDSSRQDGSTKELNFTNVDEFQITDEENRAWIVDVIKQLSGNVIMN